LFQFSLDVDVWTDDDGCEQFKIWKATDMPGDWPSPLVKPFERSRAMTLDQSNRKWEVSAAAIAALLKELSSNTEQLIAERIAAAIAELPLPKDGIDLETVNRLIGEALSAPTKISQQRKRGPKAGWRRIAAGEICRFYEKHNRYPTAEQVDDLCRDKLKDLLPKGRVLDDGSIYQLLRYLGAE
jgi:hypothetical protein